MPLLTGPLLRAHPHYRIFLAARFLFIMAMQMVNTAIAWYLYELTHNVMSQGWLGISEVIPAIGLALYAGHRVDRSNKRLMLVRGMSAYLVAVTGLTVVTYAGWSNYAGILATSLSIYLLIFCTGIFRAFTGPTFNAMVAQLVDRQWLPKAITMSSTAWQTAAVLGPVVGGFILAKAGITIMMGVAILLLAAGCLAATQLPNLPVQHSNPEQRTWASVKEGVQFVWRTKEVLTALSLDMFAVFFGGAVAMLPVYAKDILHVDATGMGILKAAQGIGTVFILFMLTRYPLQKQQGRKLLLSVAMFGVCIIVFALSKSFMLSFAALLLSGVFDGVSVVVRSTIMQLYVPDGMRGRVSSVNSMFINSSNEIGQMESGIAAKLLGTVPSVIFGGCMTLLVVAISWWKAPTLRHLQYKHGRT
ncbi:MAG TPA: MFS transporter [Phnomibacter sp.]|nr:MFS transporter [Phnomibacter sp.]